MENIENGTITPESILLPVRDLIREMAASSEKRMVESEARFSREMGDIPKMIKKVQTFRTNYPKYQNHKFYLAMASMIFDKRLEDECKKQGIAIVKQVGDMIVISDQNMKVF
jgi:hypothetical protein